jgi:hypothetical protein
MTFIHILAHFNNGSEKHGNVWREAGEEINDQKINCPKKVLHKQGSYSTDNLLAF